MDIKNTLIHLKKLKHALNNIIGKTDIGKKYCLALQFAMDELDNNDVSLTANRLSVNVLTENKKDIIIDIFYNNNGESTLLESLEFNESDIILEESNAEA
tara:strand:+ start:935 stop:1234 length:300 start_codon:yes stop_codon:yes gene_type:complete